MDKELNLGIMGCGHVAYNFLYDCTKKLPVKLKAICDMDKDNLRLFSERYNVSKIYSDYKVMLESEELDGVISFPQEDSQYEVARSCMLSGVNVFSERPVCFNLEQAKDLLEVQRKTGKYITMRLNRRFTPSYVMAKEIIHREEFGRISMYLAKYQASEYSDERTFIYYHVIHHLDLARFLLGEFKRMHVEVIRVSEKKVGFNISFVTKTDAIGIIQSGSLQSGTYPLERVEITGDRRSVIVDNIRKLEYNRPGTKKDSFCVPKLEEGSDTLVWNLNNAQLSNYSYYGFENELYDFADSIIKGKVPQLNMEDAIHTLALVEQLINLSK